MQRLWLTIFCILFLGTLAYSNPWDDQHFFVAPITTDLHRAEITTDDVFAIVNCEVVSVDGTDLSKLKPDRFRQELKKHAVHGKSLRLVPRYQFPMRHSDEVRKEIESKLKELAKEVGFEVKSSERHTSAKWTEQLRVALSYSEVDDDASETAIETPLIRAYPITTRLSKFELGESDCIVTIIRPIDGRDKDGLPKELVEAIRSAIKQIELPQKKWLKFNLTSTAAGRDHVEKLFDARPPPRPPSKPDPFFVEMFNKRMAAYKMSPSFQLALDLGFERIQFKHAPKGGSPELRVGKAAPDFQAVDLDGQDMEFTSFRNGRPALLTFWGVCLLYTSPSPRDKRQSRMPSSA